MSWTLRIGPDPGLEDRLSSELVAHNSEVSEAMRRRFSPELVRWRPVEAYAVTAEGDLVGGCAGRTEDAWLWLIVDAMWVAPAARRRGLGRSLLRAVEDEALRRGCRWSKLTTWEFQAPEFYRRCGYVVYGEEIDYPPGHVNHLMRADLRAFGTAP